MRLIGSRRVVSCWACIVFLPRLSGQQPELVLRTETRVVQIDVVVRDKSGRAVHGLDRQDFTIFDNGKPRPFQLFSVNGKYEPSPTAPPAKAPNLLAPNTFNNAITAPKIPPHSTIILLDHVNGWFDNAGLARNDVLKVLAKAPPDEPIAVYVIAKYVGFGIIQEYTTDRELLIRRVSQYVPRAMRPAPPGMENFADAMKEVPEGFAPPVPRKYLEETPREKEFAQRLAAEDVRSAFQTLAARLAAVPGRKSVFWISQGFQPREIRNPAWDDTIRALNDANVAVNAVDSNGLGGPKRYWGPGQALTLIRIAEATGGQAYYQRANDLAMLDEIAASRQTYTLGFYLADTERDGSFHKLHVRVDRPGLELHYRPGYFAGGSRELESAKKKAEMESFLLSPVDSQDVGIALRANRRPGYLDLVVSLDPAGITLSERAGVLSGKVKEMFVATTADGREVVRLSVTKVFEFPTTWRAAGERDGVPLPITIPWPEGAERLVTVVRDVASGRTGSLTASLPQR